MKPFETVKFMETQMLSTLPEAKTQTNCCLRQDQFNEANYNYRKLFSIFICWIYKWQNQLNWSTRTTLVFC